MLFENTIHIDAPPDVVWRVTTEFERWPEWTPTVKSVVPLHPAPPRCGNVFRIKQPGQPESEWTITALDPQRRFTWKTARPGLQMVATHEITADVSGTTNVLRLEIEGALAVLLWPVFRLLVPRALSDENNGLKHCCEQDATT